MSRALRLHTVTLALLSICAGLAVAAPAAPFWVTSDGRWTTWEAESATSDGPWKTFADPSASGGKYMELADGKGTLQFTFDLPRATTLMLKPVWWRNGDRKSARRYPYPLERLPGPDTVAACGSTVLFTAPAAGRVITMDAQAEKVSGVAVEGAGYPTDCVADATTNRFYIADALGARIIVMDATTRAVVGTIATPKEPWALALEGGKLFVACRAGKCVCEIDLAQAKVVQKVPTEALPISVEVVPETPGQVLVRFQQQPINAAGLETPVPDRVQYGVGGPRRSTLGAGKTWTSPKPGWIRLTVANRSVMLDVTSVTGSKQPGAGPDAMALCGDFLLFTAPTTGKVGIISVREERLVKTLDVGGRLVDIVADVGLRKAWVADAAGKRLVAIDMKKQEIAASVALPAEPSVLDFVGRVAIQREYMVPPTPINRVFVACPDGKSVSVVDATTDKLAKTVPLGFTPRRLKMVAMPDPSWWPLLADDRIAFALTARVAVEPMPVSVDPATHTLIPAPDAPETAPKHNVAKATVAGAEKSFASGNELLMRVDLKRDVDVSAVADPQLAADRALTGADTPGTMTLALDGGPAFNWRRDIWQRPDNGVFLVNDTEEYWRWNAPRFALPAGKHTLTVRATGGFTHLDAIAAETTPESAVTVTVRPQPWDLHSQVPLTPYQGVFYDREPVSFTVCVANRASSARHARISAVLRNYMDETVASPAPIQLDVPAGGQASAPLELAPTDTGRFQLVLTTATDDGQMTQDIRFVRLPKLEHPRMLFRKDDLPKIRERIAAHPQLFTRYADWLARMSQKEGSFPDRFLPNGLTKEDLMQAAPSSSKFPGDEWGWRMYELGFRMIAAEFAAEFIPGPHKAALEAKLKPLLAKPKTDYWTEYHHHGPFFPGAVEGLVDMAPPEAAVNPALKSQLTSAMGDVNVYPWTVFGLEEPLSPRDRALVYKMAMLHNNFEHYFTTHTGARGGTWWQNPWSWCYCPTQGIFLSFLFTRNLFDEERIFEKPFFKGYLTFMEYVDPIKDLDAVLPALRRPSGEPWRWILTAASRHPVEKTEYGWDEWFKQLDGPLPGPGEQKAVDDLMALKGMPLAGPLCAAPHHFNTAVSVPMAYALGWYDPAAPAVKPEERPPTTVLDVEGWVPMRSGWDEHATEVSFISGARDHTARHQANHFSIVKSGHFLVGTPAGWLDDGNCSPAWGNTVVAGSKWLERWQTNVAQPRSEETALIDRFSPMTWTYISRDRRTAGWNPAESGWGGGIDLHGHTETLMQSQGRLVAYETNPGYDYVAGDATNAWPSEELRQHYRQVVYLKPNVVVIYDRVKLGPQCQDSRWLACTGPALSARGQQFRIGSGPATLTGQVLLPHGATLTTPAPLPCFLWRKQRLLQVAAPAGGPEVEYLVVMQIGEGKSSWPAAKVTEGRQTVVVTLNVNGQQTQVSFNRAGPVGGSVGEVKDGRVHDRALARDIQDTYANWSADPRYKAWTTEDRFNFVIPERDRRK